MTDDNNNLPDDPFDIRDETMEIDDALVSDATEPVASDEEQGNWQSSLVAAAKSANLPDDIVSQLQGPNAVNDLMSIIASSLQKDTQSTGEVEYKGRRVSEEEFHLDIDEDTAFDPDAARALKSMNEYYSKKFRDLETKYAGQNGAGEINSFVNRLGPEWQEVFGPPNRLNQKNVKKLAESAETIRAGYAARHKRLPSEEDVLQMALNASFSDHQSEVARQQLTHKVLKREGQIVSRPGTRTSSIGNPRMRAAQGVAEWFKSKGIDPYSTSNDSFE